MKTRYRWITDRYFVEVLEEEGTYALVKWAIPWDAVGIVLVLALGILGFWWLI